LMIVAVWRRSRGAETISRGRFDEGRPQRWVMAPTLIEGWRLRNANNRHAFRENASGRCGLGECAVMRFVDELCGRCFPGCAFSDDLDPPRIGAVGPRDRSDACAWRERPRLLDREGEIIASLRRH